MRILELFSGTHSIGKVADKLGYTVVSLDRDLGAEHDGYKSKIHLKKDIMTWDYKQFKEGFFDVITASPVCLYWSSLRNTWIGRKCKTIHPTDIITKEHIENDIDKYGKPMVDKIFEIIEHFKPNYWWIENPQTGRMKNYIAEKYPQYNKYYDVDYCKYSDWGYKKKTRFWTNLEHFEPKTCNNDCENIVVHKNQKIHKDRMGTSKTVIDNGKIIRVNTKALREKYKDYDNIQTKHKKNISDIGGGSNRLGRYRIPEKLIMDLFKSMYKYN